jgi:predicted nucleic acid-binding protein
VIAYVDSSVVLARVLGQRPGLRAWDQIDVALSSHLVEVECLRTLDRLRLECKLPDLDIVSLHEGVQRYLASAHLILPTAEILERAGRPLPVALGTLDALHLATALAWQEAEGERVTMATHDGALALAARSQGLDVIGIEPVR